MKTQPLLFFLLSLAYLHVAGQSRSDDFSSNHLNWNEEDAQTYSMHVVDGHYSMQTQEGRYSWARYYIAPEQDYSISATFTQVSGVTNQGLGLIWGIKGDSLNRFIFATNGFFKVSSTLMTGNKLDEWQETTLVRPLGERNSLRLVKRGNRITYFLNDNQVYESPAVTIFSQQHGFVVYAAMGVLIDDYQFTQDIKINLIENPITGVAKENLGPQINSPYEEVHPIITSDGSILYFARKNCPDNTGGVTDNEDIWYSEKINGKWGPRKNMGPPINNIYANNMASVSTDNNTLMFHHNSGFALRHRTQDSWSEFEQLPISFDNESNFLEAALSPDGKAIVFATKLKGNLFYDPKTDERDLYVVLKRPDKTWSEPINLGRNINTKGKEVSPFLSADGQGMYFATDGRPGYGNMDIFYSKRLDNTWTYWSEPVNLGPSINTVGFDAYYAIPASADYAYMVSDIGSYGKLDIVRLKLNEQHEQKVALISGRVLNAKTKEPVAAKIYYHDLATNTESGEGRSDPKTGEFSISLNNGVNYGVSAEAAGFIAVHENMTADINGGYSESSRDLLMVPIEVGAKLELNNVFFERGLPELKSGSYVELDRLTDILNTNENIEIELHGYTDDVGNRNDLIKLSKERVNTVMSYLISKGISKRRMTGKGMGPDDPVAPNDTEENRMRNRRVELLITKS